MRVTLHISQILCEKLLTLGESLFSKVKALYVSFFSLAEGFLIIIGSKVTRREFSETKRKF